MQVMVDASDGDVARAVAARTPGVAEAAEAELYRRFAQRIRLYGLRHLRDEDAARDLTWYVEHGEPLHPVIQIALEEAEEISAETVVEPGTPADGKSLKELRLETETGMFVLAVQRGARWIYRPRGPFVLRAGDRLIAVGPEEGAEALDALCRVSAPAAT